MAKQKKDAHLYALAKRGAEARLGELLQEMKLLVGLFPHLRDSFDADELPLPFILASGARGGSPPPRGGRRRVSAAARRAMRQPAK